MLSVFSMRLKRLIILVLAALVFSAPLQAEIYDRADVCHDYAAKSVAQFHAQQMLNCGFADVRWNEDGAGQQQWCRTVSPQISEKETQARAQLLMHCINPQSSINLSDLTVSAEQLTQNMQDAARRGAYERLQQLIAVGANLTSQQSELMNNALVSYQLKTLNFLYGLGIPLQVGKLNPLDIYISYGSDAKVNAPDLQLLQWLINHGVDPNQISSVHTPLTTAIENQNLPALALLLEAGASPNLDIYGKNCTTNMPLDFAIDKGNEAIIMALRKAGAKTQAQCSRP